MQSDGLDYVLFSQREDQTYVRIYVNGATPETKSLRQSFVCGERARDFSKSTQPRGDVAIYFLWYKRLTPRADGMTFLGQGKSYTSPTLASKFPVPRVKASLSATSPACGTKSPQVTLSGPRGKVFLWRDYPGSQEGRFFCKATNVRWHNFNGAKFLC